ncbi:MAG: hypothetical protein LBQ51_02305 [Desulfovibrio sp.]|nr:hypothetical protein [Desulfovibrio sp.]
MISAPKTWKKKFSIELLNRLKGLLDPAKTIDEDAKGGVLFLSNLQDSELLDIFYFLMVKKEPPTALAQRLVVSGKFSGVSEVQLSAAFRRLSIIAIPIAKEIEGLVVGLPAVLTPTIKMKVAPGSTSMREHLLEAARADKNIDGVARMAGLVTLLWRQLEGLYSHISRGQNPFMMLGSVNSSAGLYMAALEKLHRMQMDVGIVQRVPDKLEIDAQTVGAFQTYIGELDNGGVEQMMAFAASFKQLIKERRDIKDVTPMQ